MEGIFTQERLLIRSEAAAYLRVSIRTLDELVRTGKIPFSRVGKRSVRFQKSDLDGYLGERKKVPFRRRG